MNTSSNMEEEVYYLYFSHRNTYPLAAISIHDLYVTFGINTTPTAREIMYNNFEISLVVFMTKITINHGITYTN